MEDKQLQAENLAREVLQLSRNTLMVNLRFLDTALSRFTMQATELPCLLTDGEYFLFGPMHVLSSYKASPKIPARDYLHMVLHCVFRHMFVNPALDRNYWNLACDIAVENVITDLGISSVAADRVRLQEEFISAIKADLKAVTAEKIYSYLRTAYPDPNSVAEIRGLFYADSHLIWYMDKETKGKKFNLPMGGQEKGNRQETESQWEQISQHLQMDLETFSQKQGSQAGSLEQNLQEVNREKYDYTAFLKKFAVMNEAMRLNDQEFDYIYYTYGLELYENMPLIEPLEYKEVKCIKEFVIAIDTSASTSGELVQRFIQKTYNILLSTESFFSKINLHIIQCDAAIQSDDKITRPEGFSQYLKTSKIRGLGGTDFRPVFEHVEQLRACGEFQNLKGLIYFTDGYGVFPKKKPDYETAFVFIDDGTFNEDIPSWAIKLVLQDTEI